MRFSKTWTEFFWEIRLQEDEARFDNGASDTVTCYRKYYKSEGKERRREREKPNNSDMDKSHGLIFTY